MTKEQQQKIEVLMAEYVTKMEAIRKKYRQQIEKILDDIDAIKLEQIKNKLRI